MTLLEALERSLQPYSKLSEEAAQGLFDTTQAKQYFDARVVEELRQQQHIMAKYKLGRAGHRSGLVHILTGVALAQEVGLGIQEQLTFVHHDNIEDLPIDNEEFSAFLNTGEFRPFSLERLPYSTLDEEKPDVSIDTTLLPALRALTNIEGFLFKKLLDEYEMHEQIGGVPDEFFPQSEHVLKDFADKTPSERARVYRLIDLSERAFKGTKESEKVFRTIKNARYELFIHNLDMVQRQFTTEDYQNVLSLKYIDCTHNQMDTKFLSYKHQVGRLRHSHTVLKAFSDTELNPRNTFLYHALLLLTHKKFARQIEKKVADKDKAFHQQLTDRYKGFLSEQAQERVQDYTHSTHYKEFLQEMTEQ